MWMVREMVIINVFAGTKLLPLCGVGTQFSGVLSLLISGAIERGYVNSLELQLGDSVFIVFVIIIIFNLFLLFLFNLFINH